MAGQLCELEAMVSTVNTRLEQLMALNDRLVEEKAQLKTQVGGAADTGLCLDAARMQGPRFLLVEHTHRQQCLPLAAPSLQRALRHCLLQVADGSGAPPSLPPATQIHDLQLRAQAADSSKAQAAALRQERAELAQQAQALATQVAERDAQLQALTKTNGELRCVQGTRAFSLHRSDALGVCRVA